MFSLIVNVPKDVDIQTKLTNIHIDNWLKDDVFHFNWWLLLFLLIGSFILWYRFLDKSRAPEICLYMVLAIIVFMGVFEYGDELILWDYPTDIIPIFHPLTSINLISLPLIYSIIYQNFKTNKRFIWATLISTLIVCFIIEPLLSLVGLFKLLNWRYYYSFPLYTTLAISIRVVVVKINRINEIHKNTNVI